MNTVEFVKYKPTPGEKYLGIITIMINNLIFLRYKIAVGKQGGFFPNPANYKISEGGQDSYISAFGIESNMLNEEVQSCIKSNINRILGTAATQYQAPRTAQYQAPSSAPDSSFNEIPF